MTTFSYIQKRIAILSVAALLALLLLLFGRSGSSNSTRQASTNTVDITPASVPAVPVMKAVTTPMGSTRAAATKSAGECTITPMALPLFPLEGDTISLSKSLSLAPEDAKLADLLKIANPEKTPKFEQVSAYHLAGRVLLYRALYLMDFARTGTKKPLTIPAGTDFLIPVPCTSTI